MHTPISTLSRNWIVNHHCTHLTTLFNHLQPATSTGRWSFFEGGWLVHHGWPIYVDTPKPRSPTSSHRVTNSKVMWDEPRWIQRQHSLKNSAIWRVPERYSWRMKQRDGFKFLNVLCFCFHKTFSQNFWTISGWICVELVPKFHLAIWPFQETVAEEWLQLHPSGSIWCRFWLVSSWWTFTITIHHSNKWGMKTHPDLHPPASFQIMAYSP